MQRIFDMQKLERKCHRIKLEPIKPHQKIKIWRVLMKGYFRLKNNLRCWVIQIALTRRTRNSFFLMTNIDKLKLIHNSSKNTSKMRSFLTCNGLLMNPANQLKQNVKPEIFCLKKQNQINFLTDRILLNKALTWTKHQQKTFSFKQTQSYQFQI